MSIRPVSRGVLPSVLALRDVIAVGSKVQRVVARRAGLSESELVTLQHLIEGARGPAEVARLLEVSTAASTGIVDRLVSHGHVERHANPDDRRRTDLYVTPSGRAEVFAHLAPMFLGLRAVDAEFDEDERAVVARYLTKAAAVFESVITPPAVDPG